MSICIPGCIVIAYAAFVMGFSIGGCVAWAVGWERKTMKPNRLRHDVAWATTLHIVEVFAQEEEQTDEFQEVYIRVVAALEAYEIQREREQRRMHPR